MSLPHRPTGRLGAGRFGSGGARAGVLIAGLLSALAMSSGVAGWSGAAGAVSESIAASNIASNTAASPALPPPTVSPRTSTGQGTLTRVAGVSRIATSIAISKTSFPTARTAGAVVLARADDFSDALAGGPLAVRFQGPLLLTPTTELTPDLRNELLRVLPSGAVVYLLGGVDAISADIEVDLKSTGFDPIRVAGVDRFDTAVKIAGILGDPPSVFEVDGTNFPDGLSAGPAAALSHGALLLTNGSLVAPETAAYLALHPSDTRYAVGGPAATADPSAQRLVGADRYATSVIVARQLFAAPSVVTLASGAVFADALSGGPASALAGAPLILVPATGPLPTPVQGYLDTASNSVLSALLFGGTAAVSTPVARMIAQALVLVPAAY
jgi:putative cell wall-binding protein